MILVDTQVAYWAVTSSDRLGALTVRRMATSKCYVSSVTVVEFHMKAMKGKLRLPPHLAEALASQGLHSLPFSADHADGLLEFPSLVGHDPFDRMLVAQARAEGFTFLTSDRVLLGLELPWIIDATR